MKRLPLATRDLKKLPSIARVIFDGTDHRNIHKQVDLFCEADGYRNLHGVHAELKSRGEPKMPALGSITLHQILLTLAKGLQDVVYKHSGGKQSLNLPEAYLRVARANLEPLTIYKSTVEHLHTQRLLADVDKRELPEPARTAARDAARRQAELEQCWTPDHARMVASGAGSYMIAVSHDPMLPPYTAKVQHWPTAKKLFNAALAVRTQRDLPPEVNILELLDPERKSLFRTQVVVQGRYMEIEDFVAQERIPYHEVIWLFSEEGEYIGRVLRNTVHGAIVAGLLHTDEDVVEGKSCLLVNQPLTRIHERRYELFETHGTLPVFTLKPGQQPPRSVMTLQDRPNVPVKDLVRVPNIHAGYLLMSNLGGTRVDEKVWQIQGWRIAAYPERATNLLWSVSYFETERWLEESDFPELFSDPQPVNLKVLNRGGTADDPRTFLPTYATDLQDRATFLLNSVRNGRIDQDILANDSRFDEVERKLKAQAERIAAVKAYVQERKEMDQAAEEFGDVYLYGRVPVTEPESLKLVKRG